MKLRTRIGSEFKIETKNAGGCITLYMGRNSRKQLIDLV